MKTIRIQNNDSEDSISTYDDSNNLILHNLVKHDDSKIGIQYYYGTLHNPIGELIKLNDISKQGSLWEETKHPRDDGGKFTSGSNGNGNGDDISDDADITPNINIEETWEDYSEKYGDRVSRKKIKEILPEITNEEFDALASKFHSNTRMMWRSRIPNLKDTTRYHGHEKVNFDIKHNSYSTAVFRTVWNKLKPDISNIDNIIVGETKNDDALGTYSYQSKTLSVEIPYENDDGYLMKETEITIIHEVDHSKMGKYTGKAQMDLSNKSLHVDPINDYTKRFITKVKANKKRMEKFSKRFEEAKNIISIYTETPKQKEEFEKLRINSISYVSEKKRFPRFKNNVAQAKWQLKNSIKNNDGKYTIKEKKENLSSNEYDLKLATNRLESYEKDHNKYIERNNIPKELAKAHMTHQELQYDIGSYRYKYRQSAMIHAVEMSAALAEVVETGTTFHGNVNMKALKEFQKIKNKWEETAELNKPKEDDDTQ